MAKGKKKEVKMEVKKKGRKEGSKNRNKARGKNDINLDVHNDLLHADAFYKWGRFTKEYKRTRKNKDGVKKTVTVKDVKFRKPHKVLMDAAKYLDVSATIANRRKRGLLKFLKPEKEKNKAFLNSYLYENNMEGYQANNADNY